MKRISIIVNPNFNMYYYSYYLKVFQHKGFRVEYNSNSFPRFHDHCLALQLNNGNSFKKIYISAGDGTGFNKLALDWCDIYAKVNINKSSIPKKYSSKILPIGPSFGIKYLDWFESLKQAIITLNKSNISLLNSRNHFANYFRQWKYRTAYALYKKLEPDANFVFHASTLWRKEQNTNKYRASFMEECISNPKINFEGGFAPGKETYLPEFNHLVMNKKYNHTEYLKKINNSIVVFNTPAVKGCLGWKLGEYLALGKAIISTPILNLLPSPLINGKHIHTIDGSRNSIHDAINLIQSDKSYRENLQNNARAYFVKYLSPSSIFSRIIEPKYLV